MFSSCNLHLKTISNMLEIWTEFYSEDFDLSRRTICGKVTEKIIQSVSSKLHLFLFSIMKLGRYRTSKKLELEKSSLFSRKINLPLKGVHTYHQLQNFKWKSIRKISKRWYLSLSFRTSCQIFDPALIRPQNYNFGTEPSKINLVWEIKRLFSSIFKSSQFPPFRIQNWTFGTKTRLLSEIWCSICNRRPEIPSLRYFVLYFSVWNSEIHVWVPFKARKFFYLKLVILT